MRLSFPRRSTSASPRRPLLAGLGAIAALSMTAVLLPATPAAASVPVIDGTDPHPVFLGKTHYTGEFHSHTSISDGVQLPENAYAYVEANTDVDFFSASEHDVTMDIRAADDWIDDHKDAESAEWKYLKSGAEEHNANGDNELIAVPGEEVTWYDASGHINLFNAEWFVTAPGYVRGSGDNLGGAFPTGDFMYDLPTFYARLAADSEVIGQFNHPSPNGKGNFDGFTHLTPDADAKVSLFEHKGVGYDAQWQLALDNGWHLAPVFNGDEHGANWVTSNPALTGVWADERSLDGVHAAMRDRSMYSTLDQNAILAYSGNGSTMGSTLPSSTTTMDIAVQLADPDPTDSFTSVQVISNKGRIAHDFEAVSGSVLDLSATVPTADGDYFFVKAKQADGDQLVSAPIWIGETVRGANYAPEITIDDATPKTAAHGQTIELPTVTATDDGGKTPSVSIDVYNSEHRLPVRDGAFLIEGYDDHFIVIKATDDTGSTSAEIRRIQVQDVDFDPNTVFRHFGTVANIGAVPGEAGLSAATDLAVETAWARIYPLGGFLGAGEAIVAASENARVFEVNSIATEADTYIDSITSHTLRSHEFSFEGLDVGTQYEYRFGVSENGPWTEPRGQFLAGGADDTPVYVLGDVQVSSGDPADFALPAKMLEQLRQQRGGGETVIQVGDLVDNGGNAAQWTDTFAHSLKGLDLQFATMVGNHETYGDHEVNTALSTERSRIFTSMFNLPKNGSEVGESNYAFDRGDIHFSVLNSNFDLDTQLAWLEEDVRASNAKWNVVMGHFPYYGGRHSSDAGMSISRAKITRTLQQLGVDLHIGGHDHVYKRSTILDGALVTDDAQKNLGTTFVTMGSSGPKFYDNQVQWWDDEVFDDDTQTGLVLEAVGDELRADVYTIDGEIVDEFAVTKPEGLLRVTSHPVIDGALAQIGLLSTEGSAEDVVVVAAAYDLSGEELVDIRTAKVSPNQRGIEQLVSFDSPLPVRSDNNIRLFVWDGLNTGTPVHPALLVREGMPGEGTASSPYELRTWADIEKIVQEPTAHYALMNDLDLGGVERAQIGGGATPFEGVFDGRGHTIRGYVAEATGSGLFQTNEGTIRDLAVVEAAIVTTLGPAGILADVNLGTIERSWTSGSITAPSRVGGLVGDSSGVIRDSYSTAKVRSSGTEAGGLIGVALAGSITENVYASGIVSADVRNVGGIAAYGYNGTEIRNSMALNTAVTAPGYAHAVLGRVLAGHAATLENNHASDDVFVSAQSLADAPAADNLKGALVAAVDARSAAHFSGTLGWDLGEVWEWNEDAGRPVLRSNPEIHVEEVPDVPANEDGLYEIATAAELELLAEYPDERFVLTADIDLTGTTFTTLGGMVPFSGELDGAGHVIRGLESETGGLLNLNSGHIHDIAIEDAQVSNTVARAGILVNVNAGTIERVYTSGEISGTGRVGGILGDSSGVLRDAYTSATVHGSATEVGGAVAVALAGSTTERVYATGAVSSDTRNIGGVVGYGYTGTIIRDSIALAPTVTAPSWAHRFLGRVLSGNTATLSNNWASPVTAATVQTDSATPSTSNLHGGTATTAQLASSAFYRSILGFDTAGVWQWNADAERPLLRGVGVARGLADDGEEEPEEPQPEGPALATDPEGRYLVEEPADLEQIVAYPAESYLLTADLDLTGIETRIEGVFSGRFDGGGHTIRGYQSTVGGLFAQVTGTVTALVVEDAAVTSTSAEVGILVDKLMESGVVSEVRTSGAISGPSTVGGIVGYLYGRVSDSLSEADVVANAGRQAGGVAGIAGRGSVTERVFAGGNVEVVGNQNAGGVVGYSYATTTVQKSVALNPTVTASAHAGRVVARELGSEQATLVDNLAVDSLVITGQTVTEEGAATRNGQTITVSEAAAQATYEAIGWDFGSVWAWDTDAGLPTLRNAR